MQAVAPRIPLIHTSLSQVSGSLQRAVFASKGDSWSGVGNAGDADDQADAAPVYLSRAQLHTVATATHGSASGEFTLVLSTDSPFVDAAHERRVGANWLSTAGRVTGTVFFRFVLPDGEILQPRTQLLLEGEDVLGAIVGARAYACLQPGAGAANLAGGVAGWIHRAAGWVHRAADWMRARGRRLPTCATNETWLGPDLAGHNNAIGKCRS